MDWHVNLLNYLSKDTKINLSMYRLESSILILACGIILYISYSITIDFVDVILLSVPRQFLIHPHSSNMDLDLLVILGLFIVLKVIMRLLYPFVYEKTVEKVFYYTVKEVLILAFCIYVLRYAISVSVLYKNGDIKNVNSIVTFVAFIYLFVYKIGGYIFNDWEQIIERATRGQAIYADRTGEPIYEGDYIAFKGKIYIVEKCFCKSTYGTEKFVLRSINKKEAIDVNTILEDGEHNDLIKIKSSN